MAARGMSQGDDRCWSRGRMPYRPDTSYDWDITHKPRYKRENSLDSYLYNNRRPVEQVDCSQARVRRIPVLHVQSPNKEVQNKEAQQRDIPIADNRTVDRRSQQRDIPIVDKRSVDDNGQKHDIPVADKRSEGNTRKVVKNKNSNSIGGISANSCPRDTVLGEDILFNRASGVTRVPANRVRRHSVQFGGSGPLYLADRREGGPVHVVNTPQPVDTERIGYKKEPLNFTNSAYQQQPNSTIVGYSDERPQLVLRGESINRTPDQEIICPVQHVQPAIGKYRNEVNRSGTVPSHIVSKVPQHSVNNTQHYIGDHPSIPRRERTRPRVFQQLPPEMPEVIPTTRTSEQIVPVDLTPMQSDNSSHMICYKNSNYIPSGYASDVSSEIDSQLKRRREADAMGVMATERPRRLSVGSNLGDNKSDLRHGTAIYIRRPSLSSLTLSKDSYVKDADGHIYRTDDTDDGASEVETNDKYVKRNIHVRRHSISTPSALRQAPKPRLLRDFQAWGAHSTSDMLEKTPTYEKPTSNANFTDATNANAQRNQAPMYNQCGNIVPARRYSVTYVPRTDASDSDSGVPQEPVHSKIAREKSKNRKRFTRRRCRPLSIVDENVFPLGRGPSDTDTDVLTDDCVDANKEVTSYGEPMKQQNLARNSTQKTKDPTTVNIQRDDGNVSIVAGGNVHISLNTDKPMSMVGCSAPDQSGEFAMWTGGSELAPFNGMPGKAHNSFTPQGPIGMWRHGNVIVDSVSPMTQGDQLYQPCQYPGTPQNQAPYMAPGLPFMQPVPMMYHPYLDPRLHSGCYHNHGHHLQALTPQDKSLYSPLAVDIGQTPRKAPEPSQPLGLLQAAGYGTPLNDVKTPSVRKQPMLPNYANPPPHNMYNGSHLVNGKAVPTATQRRGSGDRINRCDSLSNNQRMGLDLDNDVSCDIVSQTDDLSPVPQFDVKEMIADFELKSDSSSTAPQFGVAYGSREGSRRVSLDASSQTLVGQTNDTPVDGGKYQLDVEQMDKWMNTDAQPEKQPTTIHAYIEEMSISEVRYGNNDGDKKEN